MPDTLLGGTDLPENGKRLTILTENDYGAAAKDYLKICNKNGPADWLVKQREQGYGTSFSTFEEIDDICESYLDD